MWRPFVRRTCVACELPFRQWSWEAMQRFCGMRCQRAFDRGYDLGLRASGRYRHESG
jgi:hypothetical protein